MEQQAHLTHIEIFVDGGDRPIAKRYWPCIPRSGEQIFVREIVSAVRVERVFWGDYMIGDTLDPEGRVSVGLQCTKIEGEDEELPSMHPGAMVSVRDAASDRKLAIARAALYDMKLFMESAPTSEQKDRLHQTLMDTLDHTRDEAADQHADAIKRITELDAEVLSLRTQLARAIENR